MNSFTNWNDTLCHSGRKGQKWRKRLYQNYDGSYTELGRIHYGIGASKRNQAKGYVEPGGAFTRKGAEHFSRTPRATVKNLTKMDKRYADQAAELKAAKAKRDKYQNSLSQDKKKQRYNARVAEYLYEYGSNVNEAKKYAKAESAKQNAAIAAKVQKYNAKASAIEKYLKTIESNQWRLMGAAAQKGWQVQAERFQRTGQTINAKIAGFLGGAVGSLAFNSITKGNHLETSDSYHYKIRR